MYELELETTNFRAAYLDEDDGSPNCHETIETDQDIVFRVLTVALDVKLFDAFDGKFFVFESDLICIGREVFGVIDDIIGECSRKQDNLRVWWKRSEDMFSPAI